MIWYIFLKLLSESMLSFYPAMVKWIKFPIVNQLWGRLVVYTVISMIFMNWRGVWNYLFSWIGLILAAVNILHIYTSYVGFNNLEAGVSYSIFYIYPLVILLFSGWFKWWGIIPLIGAGLLGYSNWRDLVKEKEEEGKKKWLKGIGGILGAMITEVLLFFIVKRFGGDNKWNVLFIAYLLPAIVVSCVLNKRVLPRGEMDKKEWLKNVGILLGVNGVIGALGYYLRFYTIGKLPVVIYSGLSYFGIIMAYVYGWSLNKEKVGWFSLVGSLLIIIGGLLISKN